MLILLITSSLSEETKKGLIKIKRTNYSNNNDTSHSQSFLFHQQCISQWWSFLSH